MLDNKKFSLSYYFFSSGVLPEVFLSAGKSPFIANKNKYIKEMKIKVDGETKFSAKKNQFAVAPTTSGYQVAYSADGENFTLDADAIVPANENLIYLGSMQYGYYKLMGNTDNDVTIIL